MPDSDLYVGLAGVAVVFAGFSGISIVLTGRQPEQWRYVDAERLSAMISLSFATAFLLALSANTLRVVLALSEGFYLVALVCYLGLAARMFFRTLTVLRGAGGE